MTLLDRVAFAKKFNHKPRFMQLNNMGQFTPSIIKDEILGKNLAFWEKNEKTITLDIHRTSLGRVPNNRRVFRSTRSQANGLPPCILTARPPFQDMPVR